MYIYLLAFGQDMKRQKMITLCPTTYEIAQGMTNFSSWVRKQLLDLTIVADDEAIEMSFECTGCDTTLITKGHNLHEVPHATRRLGEFMHESCTGYFKEVKE